MERTGNSWGVSSRLSEQEASFVSRTVGSSPLCSPEAAPSLPLSATEPASASRQHSSGWPCPGLPFLASASGLAECEGSKPPTHRRIKPANYITQRPGVGARGYFSADLACLYLLCMIGFDFSKSELPTRKESPGAVEHAAEARAGVHPPAAAGGETCSNSELRKQNASLLTPSRAQQVRRP